MNVISVIKLLPESQDQIVNFSREMINMLDSGEVNPLDVLINIKGFEAVIKNIKEKLNQLALDEAQKYSEKLIKHKGAELQIRETGVKYDFSDCGDIYWSQYRTNKESIETKIKERELFLKDIKDSVSIIDEDSGEVFTVNPPAKTSTTSVVVKII